MNDLFDFNDDHLVDDLLQDDLSTHDDFDITDDSDLLTAAPEGSSLMTIDDSPNSLFDDDDEALVATHHLADDPVSFGGSAEDAQKQKEDNEWYSKQAAHAFEEENWHLKEAEKAAEKGDFAAAKDHRSRAESWHSTGTDYQSKIKPVG